MLLPNFNICSTLSSVRTIYFWFHIYHNSNKTIKSRVARVAAPSPQQRKNGEMGRVRLLVGYAWLNCFVTDVIDVKSKINSRYWRKSRTNIKICIQPPPGRSVLHSIDCEQSLIFLCKVTARKTQADGKSLNNVFLTI